VAKLDQRLRDELDVLVAGRTRSSFPPSSVNSRKGDPLEVLAAPPTGNTADQRLVLETSRQDVGGCKPGETVTCQVFVRNGGMKPLTISGMTGSEGLTISGGGAKTLRPQVSIGLNCSFTAPMESGPVSHTLTIFSDDPARPSLAIELSGYVRPWLELDPVTGINFGSNPHTFSISSMATITYNGTDSIEYLSANSSSDKFAAAIRPIGKTGNIMLTVSPKPPFEVGEHRATVTVETTCKPQPKVEVPVVLVQPERIVVAPEFVEVSRQRRLRTASVSIKNNGNEPIHILAVERSNRMIRTQFFPEPDGFSYQLQMTFLSGYVPSPGDKVVIKTDDKEYPEIVIPIRQTPRN
jgi:hypothetical protein